ncbi:glutamine-hydrolyzing carbamoyl-phosphate synthase small subunit [Blattabacterium cuenoti]|uniref:glutamine-hydrolyzing carbamoyl-phosphate synthase small subunit n=1 Tax=Blattabacterium cuenoti TaxID=1653831 RepID=UPI00163C3A01|nr:glutamine-hydrolyzing carbamoyl-phosphate synthase small subunit [Blattabacterium cuenoti]
MKKNITKRRTAKLILEDGTKYEAYHFGAPVSSSGEVVFNTAMTGYTESLTDPSYKGQILTYTYPIIGNYGIPFSFNKESIHEFYESDKIQVSGLIISYYSNRPYHWNMFCTLSDWLLENGVPGLYGVDTRLIAQKLRKKGGAMLGKILMDKEKEDIPFYDPNQDNLSEKVSIHEKIIYGNGKYKILLVDFGLKNNILRCLLRRNCSIIRVPWDYDYTKEKEEYNGIVLSNGPGNPKIYEKPISYIRMALRKEHPIFGICLGNQLLGIAAGGDTYKLTYAHRGHNQPVLSLETGKSFITSQNHGYGLDTKNISGKWKIFFKNLNDNTCEGLIHEKKPFFSVQFHPEASSGPKDTEFLFDLFLSFIKKRLFKKN